MKRPRSPSQPAGEGWCPACGKPMMSAGNQARNACTCGKPFVNLWNQQRLVSTGGNGPSLVPRTQFREWKEMKVASLSRNQLSFSNGRDQNINTLLRLRETRGPLARASTNRYELNAPFLSWAERITMLHGEFGTFETGNETRGTISISFSHGGRYFATTHGGDHSVRVFDSQTRSLQCSLLGHPRTPWTVRFHPKDEGTVASGCLGFEARIWDIRRQKTIRLSRLNYEIVSIAFHPSGKWLAIASGRTVYLWEFDKENAHPVPFIARRRNVRCVGFTPCGSKMLIGEPCFNHSKSSLHRINGRSEVTVELMVWDFHVDAVENWFESDFGPIDHSVEADGQSSGLMELSCPGVNRLRRTKPITVVPHGVLYNDGGFGISECGRYLCAVLYQDHREKRSQDTDMTDTTVGARTPPLRPIRVGATLLNHREDLAPPPHAVRSRTPDDGFTPRVASIAKRVNSIDLKEAIPFNLGLAESHRQTGDSRPSNFGASARTPNQGIPIPAEPAAPPAFQSNGIPGPTPTFHSSSGPQIAQSRSSQGTRSSSWGSASEAFSHLNGDSATRRSMHMSTIQSGSPPKIPRTRETDLVNENDQNRFPIQAHHHEPQHHPRPTMNTSPSDASATRAQLRRHIRSRRRQRIRSMEIPTTLLWDAQNTSRPNGASTTTTIGSVHSAAALNDADENGTYRLVRLSLETSTLGRVEQDIVLDGNLAQGITSVKFGPTGETILIGYGVQQREEEDQMCKIAALFRVKDSEQLEHVHVIKSRGNGVNIAVFHPIVGYGFVYGTKQGEVCSYGLGREKISSHYSGTSFQGSVNR